MKHLFTIILILVANSSFSQKVEISGIASGQISTNSIVEIVINDTLAKVVTDPKLGRSKYMKMYQDKNFVVRTDSSNNFKIKAHPKDTLYFKSYGHVTQKHKVEDLLKQPDVQIILEPQPSE